MAKTMQRSETMNYPKFTCNHINQKQLADRWDLSERTLERWRAIGWAPLPENRWPCGLPGGGHPGTRSSTWPIRPNRGYTIGKILLYNFLQFQSRSTNLVVVSRIFCYVVTAVIKRPG